MAHSRRRKDKFDRRPDRSLYQLVRRDGRLPTEDDLKRLVSWLGEKLRSNAISEQTVNLFSGLACLPVKARIKINLDRLMDRMLKSERIVDSLAAGLSESEERALIELERCNAPVDVQGVAHALLCLDQRTAFIDLFKREFARSSNKNRLYVEQAEKLLRRNG